LEYNAQLRCVADARRDRKTGDEDVCCKQTGKQLPAVLSPDGRKILSVKRVT